MIIEKDAFAIANAVKNGEIKAEDVARKFLNYVKSADKKVEAFNSLDEERIIKAAIEVDKKRDRGEELGELAGVPFIIKDNIMSEGEPVTCSSKMMLGYKAIYDATVVKKIRSADGIPFGKANMDEFAMGSSTENSAFRMTKNPWDFSRVPGGSSGGSAASVAALMSPLSLGSDTGGSIRQPSAFCGVVGLKPTYGRVSRYGLVSFGSSLDQIGPIGRNARDTALAMNVISGYDQKDSTSAKTGVSDFTLSLDNDIKGLRVGLLEDHMLDGTDSSIVSALNKTKEILKDMGAVFKKVCLNNISLSSLEAYYVISPAEVSSNLSRFDGLKYGAKVGSPKSVEDIYLNSREHMGDEVKRRVMIGNYVLSAGHYDSHYKKAYQVRRIIFDEFKAAFEDVDVVLLPTSPTTAFKIGENTGDPVKMYLSDLYTTPANLAGIPALSFPVDFHDNLPVGMQLIGRSFDEALLLNIVSQFEKRVSLPKVRRMDV